MAVGILTIHLFIPGCTSLKEKRAVLSRLLNRIHREFNVAVAEVGRQDKWTDSEIAIANICNNGSHAHSEMEHVKDFIFKNFRNLEIIENHTEIIL